MNALLTMPAVLCVAVASAPAQQPVGHWDFREQAVVVADRSGNGNALRIEGCEWVESKLGKALRVPGGSGRIWCEKPGEPLRPTQALGIIAWVRPLGTAPYAAVADHGRGWGEEGTVGYRLLVYRDGVRLLLRAGRTVNISGGKILRGQWNQVAADWKAGKGICLALEEITAERCARLEKCSLASVPDAPFVRGRHTTLLAHMDAKDHCDADYSRVAATKRLTSFVGAVVESRCSRRW